MKLPEETHEFLKYLLRVSLPILLFMGIVALMITDLG